MNWTKNHDIVMITKKNELFVGVLQNPTDCLDTPHVTYYMPIAHMGIFPKDMTVASFVSFKKEI